MKKKSYNYFYRPGIIEGFVGPMMSGKSQRLLQRVDPLRWMNKKYIYAGFKPEVDNREVTCRNTEDFIHWIYIKDSKEILKVSKKIDLFIIDEIQFFDKEIVNVVLELQRQGKNVIFGGLDKNFRGEPFGSMAELILYANEIKKCFAICPKCGSRAYYTQRLIGGKPADYNEPIVSIEGNKKKEIYEPRCFKHHLVPGK